MKTLARNGLILLSALFASPCLSALATERVPIEDFARTPEFSHMQLSPDGKSIAFLSEFDGRRYLCVAELGSPDITRFQVGRGEWNGVMMPKEVTAFRWISDRRLVLTTAIWDAPYGVAAVNRDGSDWRGLSGYEQEGSRGRPIYAFDTIYAFRDEEERILMLDRRDWLGSVRFYPHVREVNTLKGTGKIILKNPGNVISWSADNAGAVRLGIARDEDVSSVIYRESESAEWRTLPLPRRGREKLRALGFDPHNGRFYVAGFNPEDRWTILPYDLTDGALGDALVSDPEYDVVPDGFTPSIAGVPLTRVVFSEAEQELVGVWYMRDAPRVKWLHPDFRNFQTAVDKALPNTVNVLVGQSRDDQQLLVFAFSDRDPGGYYLFDRATRSFKSIGARMPWLKREQMAQMYAIKYESRDGLTIHGYLTVPAGHQPKDLPLVVMPHGGPWVRDVWGFDPLVQLIASRGYAVLQMNYRGSRGYGSAFAMAGTRQVGRAIQDDIEDATRWAIESGVADPKRIAVAGASYGGYSALFALGKSPTLYRCGISFAGVTDWLAIFKHGDTREEYRFARRAWRERIGDPDEDEEFLKSISPVNFAADITAPVLLLQGKEDRTVPQRQAKTMVTALREAGREVESEFLSGEGHSLSNEKTRLIAYTRIVQFLEKHLGPGVPVAY